MTENTDVCEHEYERLTFVDWYTCVYCGRRITTFDYSLGLTFLVAFS